MLQTCLNGLHREYGAKLVDFAGWEMPLMYRGIVEEHMYTREHCSLFDVSHMGRLQVAGDGAEAFLQRICTRDVKDMPVGLSRYSHICNEQGGILDDVIVSRFDAHYLIVCNAEEFPPCPPFSGTARREVPGFVHQLEGNRHDGEESRQQGGRGHRQGRPWSDRARVHRHLDLVRVRVRVR